MSETALAILPEHLAIIQTILRAHLPADAKIFAFGSRVTGRHRKYSDLDLLIDAGQRLTVDQSADLRDDFTECALPWKVDIIDRHTTQDYFLRLIEADLVTLSFYSE